MTVTTDDGAGNRPGTRGPDRAPGRGWGPGSLTLRPCLMRLKK